MGPTTNAEAVKEQRSRTGVEACWAALSRGVGLVIASVCPEVGRGEKELLPNTHDVSQALQKRMRIRERERWGLSRLQW